MGRTSGDDHDALRALLREDQQERWKQLLRSDRKETAIIEPKGKYLIADVLKEYLGYKRMKNSWRPKTEDSVQAIFKIFAEVMGDRHFDAIGFDEMRHYEKCIFKLPKNLNCERRFKGKPITEIIKMEGLALLSNTSRNKHFSYIGALFEWAKHRGFTDQNYAVCLQNSGSKRDKKARDVFTTEDLQKIISGNEYRRVNGTKHKKHAYFWAPLIGMFTGARLNEICQLKVSDVREESGIWYFAFCSEGEEVAKTEAAIRNTPVHEMLIKLGFLNYVKWQKRNKHERLFSDLIKHSKNGYGAQVSKWFNRSYLVQVGVKDAEKDSNKKVFHSFRHTLINHLQQKGVDKDRIKAVEGHVIDDLSYYQHDQGLKVLAQVVAKIDYRLDFSHLLDRHKNEYLSM